MSEFKLHMNESIKYIAMISREKDTKRSIGSIIVIILGNKHSDPSSNPLMKPSEVPFYANALRKCVNLYLFSSAMGK